MKTQIHFLTKSIAGMMMACVIHFSAGAQQINSGRIELQRHDLSRPGQEVIQVRVDIEAGVTYPKHSHPGEEIIYVLEGTLEYQVEDEPPVRLTAGDVFFIPRGAMHSVKNVGNQKGSELATYLVAKGKPLVKLSLEAVH